MMEYWKDIEGYDGKYQISNYGNVKSLKYINRLMSLTPDKDGYLIVKLRHHSKQTTFKVHRLVATYFIDNQYDYPEINHKDGVKDNNKASNLEWVNSSMNKIHSYRMGLNKGLKGKATKRSKWVLQFDTAGNMINKFPSVSAAAHLTGTNGSTIRYQASKICRQWKYAY